MNAKRIAFTLMISFFIAPALAQELFVKKSLFSSFEPIQTTPLQLLSERSTAGDYPIPNFGAELRHGLLLTYSSTGTVQVPMGRVVALSERKKNHYLFLDMRVNLGLGNISDWISEPCKRDDFLWKRSTGASFNNQNCVSITHVVNYFTNPTGEFQTLLGHVRNDGIQVPPTVVRATFTRYAPGGRWLTYTVDINPEQFGVSRDDSTPWGSNGWHPKFISRDPKKVWFIEGVKRWATDIQDRMDRAFEKDKNAFATVRPLSEYLIEQTGGGAGAKSSITIEDEVADLKRLLEMGLITETQFNEQVKGLLKKR